MKIAKKSVNAAPFIAATAAKQKPFIAPAEGKLQPVARGEKRYFDYTETVRRIMSFLEQRFGCGFRLYYQDDSNDMWDLLEEDLRREHPGVEHTASLYDLVETDTFRYEADPFGAGLQSGGYEVRPSVRNNLFLYPLFRVAFARIPRETMHGLGYEDLIFASDDESLREFLTDMRERQLADRKIIVYSDTREGLERESLSAAPVTREDVFMDETLKTHIYRSVDEFFSEEASFFKTYNIPYKRGILLYGKPGNGKTTLVKSIASTIGAPVAYWQITEFTNSESISEVFSAAVRMAPMVLVIEDIDSMPESCRSFFLNILDGVASKEGVFLIGTTNYPERIDPALMNRAGRFDRSYEVKLPDERLRYAYLLRKGMERVVDRGEVEALARRTDGFTFAQLGELYVSAALQLHYEGQADPARIAEEMKSDFGKSRTGDWMSEGKPKSMGFV
ncbi:AAA family ATPase [Paenibacillus soyae]|uniref:ATP-binding protein n=1 Tax=Paenibacillus soyae TaxID=2969249 RepID=A0A9X2MNT7_9BACL|nr:ATP-binding protein [Paenibacillus soyae]MCR2804101.1 ATP-binding protein [Paenibacillus soyae]